MTAAHVQRVNRARAALLEAITNCATSARDTESATIAEQCARAALDLTRAYTTLTGEDTTTP